MKTDEQKVLIFTDLDGTLLDHYTYSFDAALPTIDRLQKMGAIIVPNTSKTKAEVIELNERIGLAGAFIIENGAAIIIPKDFLPEKPRGAQWASGFWVVSFAPRRSHWTGLLSKLAADFNGEFEAFSDMDIERICEVTGLSKEDASLASQRQYGEPVLWKSSADRQEAFIQQAKKYGASPLIGGRFVHLCGDTNKGKALLWLVNEYKRQHQRISISSIALGDGKNDIAMLEVAGTAVRIASPAHEPPQLTRETRVITTKGYGPVGWTEALDQLVPPIHNTIKEN
ncbi:HAD-IIB family hydrolase [Agaribacter flavus]|uniref:HAD-IIB family hydrolase n=1 Tax=Agaribacter flavus TaxID=1902781 RepID=A0ABV7FTG0_9ALTE